MSDINQKAVDFFKYKPTAPEVHATSDDILFEQKQHAVVHSQTLEDKNVITIKNDGKSFEVTVVPDKKLSPAELKAIKEQAIKDYTELFNAAPDSKLSGAKIQELIDAKKAELTNQKPEK